MFESKGFDEFLRPPQGYRPTHMLLLTYSLSPKMLNTILLQSGLYRAINGEKAETARDQVCERLFCAAQNDRLVANQLWSEFPYAGLANGYGAIHWIKPEGFHSFHPKFWAILYQGKDSESKRLRVVVSSRNLTGANSLEGALCLETDDFKNEEDAGVKPLIELLDGAGVPKENAVYIALKNADFGKCVCSSFGIGAAYRFLTPQSGLESALSNDAQISKKITIVSPFLQKESLGIYADPFGLKAKDSIVITSQTIDAKLHESIIEAESKGEKSPYPYLYYLKKGQADTKDQEDQDEPEAPFPHAKIYTFDRADGPSVLYIGSANFSQNGLKYNCELMCRIEAPNQTFAEALREALKEKFTLEDQNFAAAEAADIPSRYEEGANEDLAQEEEKKLVEQINAHRKTDEVAVFLQSILDVSTIREDSPVDYAIKYLLKMDEDKVKDLRGKLAGIDIDDVPPAAKPFYEELCEAFGLKEGTSNG